MRFLVASVEITIAGIELSISSAARRRKNSSPSTTGMLMSVRIASTHSVRSVASASSPLDASKHSESSKPESSITRRTKDRMTGESSAIKTRYAISPSALIHKYGNMMRGRRSGRGRWVRRDRRMVARESADNFTRAPALLQPERAGIDLQPDRPRIGAAHRFAVQQHAGLPQELAQCQIVPLPDIEDVVGVHDGSPARRMRHQLPRAGAISAYSLNQ